MPKMKTHRGAAKRFRFTGTGKVKRGKAYRSHILTKMSRSRKRNLRAGGIASPQDTKVIRRMLPYG